jgi:hypothetical protein
MDMFEWVFFGITTVSQACTKCGLERAFSVPGKALQEPPR